MMAGKKVIIRTLDIGADKQTDIFKTQLRALLRAASFGNISIMYPMIQMVAENAHKCGKWVGICGELEADLELTEEFLRMGIDELSVSPSMVLKVRKAVRESKISV